MFSIRFLGRFTAVLSAIASMCFAQNPDGSLVGAVTDSVGGRIPSATIKVESFVSHAKRQTTTNAAGEYRIEGLAPGFYHVLASYAGFRTASVDVAIATGLPQTLPIILSVGGDYITMEVRSQRDITSSAIKTTISSNLIQSVPLAHRSFANIAYLAPMTQPVEPSDPTKARITAVSFAGSSGLNVDLSVDGGDNNDDYIGGFLQNISPEAIDEFTVRTGQFDADTSRTNGGSVIISTKRGTDDWHGGLAGYFRETGLNARNTLDNPEPSPKQPFTRRNAVGSVGGPLVKRKLWFFSSYEYVFEDASVAYSAQSQDEFHALSQLASEGLIPGASSIGVVPFAQVPFGDSLFSTRVDWSQSDRSQWFFRGATDRYNSSNDLLQLATLPSAGATGASNYFNLLLHNTLLFNSNWVGSLTLQANNFHHTEERNSHYGFALAFPFSSSFRTTSGFETFGDNQFETPITAFPIQRDQQKYQFRYDVARSGSAHSVKFGVNFVHEPVLTGRLSDNPETLVTFPQDPSFYLTNKDQFLSDYASGATTSGGSSGVFSQSVRRLGFYLQDSWRVTPSLALNLGVRYDTTFGLFRASGRLQDQNPAYETLKSLGIGLVPGIPKDYRRAVAPRVGIAWSPSGAGNTVIRAGVGMYYNDLAQNGWVNAFQAVNNPSTELLQPTDHGALIDPNYKTPYALQASIGFEQALPNDWRMNVQYQHQQGVHQYRHYEYVSGVTLPDDAPSVSVYRTDNRSRYDGVSFGIAHRFTSLFDFTAHYTLASATTWGAVVGELFDYVNLVGNPLHAFGPGDHGPAGEDVRHRFVFAGTFRLPGKVELSALGQFESARPFTLTTPIDVNGDGDDTNDRAVVNGQQTRLDQFRGSPYYQVDMRISRPIRLSERVELRPFAELFNVFNRQNPGNNYVSSVSALPVPPDELANVQHYCLNADCSSMRPVTLKDLRVPAGGLGDFFGPGTTVGIPFAAQLGIRLTF